MPNIEPHDFSTLCTKLNNDKLKPKLSSITFKEGDKTSFRLSIDGTTYWGKEAK